MNFRLFGCGKFRRLASDSNDRSLTGSESGFMNRHRVVCPACAAVEAEGERSLKMLRLAILEPVASPTFNSRLLRRAHVDSVRAKFGYWSPALFGAAIAGIAILAAMQMIADSSRLPEISVPGGDPHMTQRGPAFPRLDVPDPASQPPR